MATQSGTTQTGVVIQFSTYGYNSLSGSIILGNTEIRKSDINSETLQYILHVDVTNGLIVPFDVVYNDVNGNAIYTVEVNQNIYDSLPVEDRPRISYPANSTFTYKVNTDINISIPAPISTGGQINSWTVVPSLPSGLSLNSTGLITGTPSNVSPSYLYTVRATNQFGFSESALTMTILEADPVFTYTASKTFTKGSAITAFGPTVTKGTPVSWSISPALPSGLVLNSSTGLITGTPTSEIAAANYTVTATNASNNTGTFTINIRVNLPAPVIQKSTFFIINNNNLTLTKNSAITIFDYRFNIQPTTTATWSISPSLPFGLTYSVLANQMLEIIGTPTVVSPSTVYTITAINSGGTASTTINIKIDDIVPIVTYASQTFTKGTFVSAVIPNVSGSGGTPTSYSATLPSGMIISSDGIISGTPTAIALSAPYTITVGYANGLTTTTSINIQVNDSVPIVTYPAQTFVKNTAITKVSPSVTGGTPTSYSATLPTGLSINATTGEITGTPTSVASGTYTVSINYAYAKSTTATIAINVNDITPVFSYAPATSYIQDSTLSLNPTVTTGSVVTWSVSAGTLPGGITLNSSTGALTGTFTSFGSATFTIKGVNSTGQFGTNALSFTINTSTPPTIVYSSKNYIFPTGTDVTITPTVVSGSVSSWALTGTLPAGLSFATATGVITGTPTTAAAVATSYSVTATNSAGTSTFTFDIAISSPLDKSLTPKWAKWIDGIDVDIVKGMAVDSNNNVYITTVVADNIQSSLTTYFDIAKPNVGGCSVLMKYNSSGVLQWGRWIDGAGLDEAYKLAIDSSNSVYVVGKSTAELQSGLTTYFTSVKPSTGYDTFVLKFSSTGTPQWGSWFDSSDNDNPNNICIDLNNNIYIILDSSSGIQNELTTYFDSVKGSNASTALIKMNSSGVIQWGKWIQGYSAVSCLGICVDSYGNVYVSGTSKSKLLPVINALFDVSDKPYGSNNKAAFALKFNTSGVIQWGRWIDGANNTDDTLSIAVDLNGNVYVSAILDTEVQSSLTTYFNTAKTGANFCSALIKYNSSGVPQWARWLDGVGNYNIYTVVTDYSNNVYISGYTDSEVRASLTTYFATPKPSSGLCGFILKYTESGVPINGQWTASASANSHIFNTVVDRLNNIYIGGYISGTGAEATIAPYFDGTKPNTSNAGILMKYTMSPVISYSGVLSSYEGGKTMTLTPTIVNSVATWSVSPALPAGLTINATTGVISGSPSGAVASNTYTITASNLYGSATTTVAFETTVPAGPNPLDITPIPQWGRWIDSSGIDNGYGVATDSSGNIYITGNTTTEVPNSLTTYFNEPKPNGSTTAGAFLMKYNSNGVPQWGRWIDTSTGADISKSVATDSSGNVYITGQAGASTSDVQSTLTTYFGGTKPPTSGVGGFLMKYNSNGVPQWGRWIDGTASDSGNVVATDSSGNVYITGQAGTSTADVQASLIQYFGGTKPTTSSNGAFLMKYDSTGTPQWGRWIDGPGTDNGQGLATDSSGNVYITGQVGLSAAVPDVQASLIQYFGGTKPPSSGVGAFLMKYDSTGTPQWGRWIDGTAGDYGFGLATDSSGNVYITGQAGTSTADVQPSLTTYFGGAKPNLSGNGGFLMKYDSTGTPQWGRWIDGIGSDVGYGVATDSVGNVYITGEAGSDVQASLTTYFGGTKPNLLSGAFVMKYNSTGTPQWGRWIDGSSNDTGRAVNIDSSGNVYITGYALGDVQSSLTTYFGGFKPNLLAGAFLMKYSYTTDVKYTITKDIYTIGDTINLIPTITNSFTSMTCSPSLPAGISFNTATGSITGTFTGTLPLTTYTINTTNFYGTSTQNINLAVNQLTTDFNNKSAVPQWGRWIDGSGTDIGRAVAIDSFGNVYIIGEDTKEVQSSLATYFNEPKPNTAIDNNGVFLMKYDSSGTPQWGRWLDASTNDNGYGVATDSLGNVYITGQIGAEVQSNLTTYFGGTKPTASTTAAFLMKYDSTGTPQWGRWLDSASADTGFGVATDPFNNVYITGATTTAIIGLSLYFDVSKPGSVGGCFLMKFNSDGVPQWGRWLDGSGTDNSKSIATDSVGNIYITGEAGAEVQASLTTYFDTAKPNGATTTGAFLMKYNSNGVPQWGRWLDGSVADYGIGVATDSLGNVYITGQGGAEVQSTLTTYFGGAKPNVGNGAFLMKYNSTGTPQWGRWLDGSGTDSGNAVAIDSSGNVYITGTSSADVQASLTTYFGGTKPNGTTSSGVFLMKYNSSGTPQWGRWIDGSGGDQGYGVAIDSSGNVYITGQTGADVQASLTTYFGGAKPNTNASTGAFIFKYSQV